MSKTKSTATDNSESEGNEPAIPTAIIGPANVTIADMLQGSYMWLVALLCLIVAIGIVWWSMPETGIEVVIHFPEGHGLKTEDAVRFRGIDVGIVEEIKLNAELSGVDVHVNLFPFAEPLAREFTRFWIVRPELSIGGISGLETAVGNKYIGLIPGDPGGEWKTVFEGLVAAPPDALEHQGIEILLRGKKRFSVTAGSPVNYRGVVVGSVLSVGLSPEGLKVDVRIRILDQFTSLVTSESKFWASSGIDASFSALGGTVDWEMESIETLFQGGVSLLTISSGGRPVKPGDDFVLHAAAEKDWYDKAELVQSTSLNARGTLPLEVVWNKKRLLGMGESEKREDFVGAHLSVSGNDYAIVPVDMLIQPEKAIEGTFQLGITGAPDTQVDLKDPPTTEALVSMVQLPPASGFSYPTPFQKNDVRRPVKPEACVAVRAKGELADLRYLPLRIELANIAEDWIVKNFDGDRTVWHGAPVLSEADGKLIGILLVGETETKIETIPDDVVEHR